jgi:hypothetical protein
LSGHLVQKIGDVVSVKIFDRMIDRQTRELSRIIQRAIVGSGGPIRLLVVLETQLPASGPEALFESLQFVKMHSDFIERIAVVGRRTWEQTSVGLFSLFGGISMRYFDRSQITEAVKWLNADKTEKPKAARAARFKKALLPYINKLKGS